jgi:flagellar protein FliS
VDDLRARYLRDRVLTASPVQRVVMLYDRLALDLRLARDAADGPSAGIHLGHASSIIAELYGSLNMSAGGPADNLANLYPFLLAQLTETRSSGDLSRLDIVEPIIATLRDAWTSAANTTAESDRVSAASASATVATSWVS